MVQIGSSNYQSAALIPHHIDVWDVYLLCE